MFCCVFFLLLVFFVLFVVVVVAVVVVLVVVVVVVVVADVVKSGCFSFLWCFCCRCWFLFKTLYRRFRVHGENLNVRKSINRWQGIETRLIFHA